VQQLGVRIADVANKHIRFKFVEGPVGVRQIVADCSKLRSLTDWLPQTRLSEGLEKTYPWVEKQVTKSLETA
jgi:nucleoside-diphosphate-sugar epimerase